ncbi:hypothetical protein BZG36_01322 [Bifiguratus adelaidae]|uniref:RING-type domain-containing protein n=1 Tax=Bifiguratus adelaidae TaxID=1938954 RepID=A0A261Y586_9FUNG|nr:hypothetical protein BZG36_01322 [Bifiguratus adelaidae]
MASNSIAYNLRVDTIKCEVQHPCLIVSTFNTMDVSVLQRNMSMPLPLSGVQGVLVDASDACADKPHFNTLELDQPWIGLISSTSQCPVSKQISGLQASSAAAVILHPTQQWLLNTAQDTGYIATLEAPVALCDASTMAYLYRQMTLTENAFESPPKRANVTETMVTIQYNGSDSTPFNSDGSNARAGSGPGVNNFLVYGIVIVLVMVIFIYILIVYVIRPLVRRNFQATSRSYPLDLSPFSEADASSRRPTRGKISQHLINTLPVRTFREEEFRELWKSKPAVLQVQDGDESPAGRENASSIMSEEELHEDARAVKDDDQSSTRRSGMITHRKSLANGKGEVCPICLEQLKDCKDQVRVLPCCHYFHVHCIDVWLRKSNMAICPLCKADVFDGRSMKKANESARGQMLDYQQRHAGRRYRFDEIFSTFYMSHSHSEPLLSVRHTSIPLLHRRPRSEGVVVPMATHSRSTRQSSTSLPPDCDALRSVVIDDQCQTRSSDGRSTVGNFEWPSWLSVPWHTVRIEEQAPNPPTSPRTLAPLPRRGMEMNRNDGTVV